MKKEIVKIIADTLIQYTIALPRQKLQSQRQDLAISVVATSTVSILKLMEEAVPEEKRTPKDDSFDRADHDTPIELEAYNEGYNACRTDLKSKLGEK